MSDLDNEELEATRRLNGVAKEEIEKAILRDAKKNLLDKNDTESAKIIVEKCLLGNWVIVGGRINYIKLALRTLLAEREQKDKRIKELEEENSDLKIKNNSRIIGSYAEVRLEEILKEDYIPVQKVKDLKKSIILEPTIVGGRRNAKTLEYGIKLGKIKACEELLEEK